eukprot:gene5411-5644_t
MSRILLLSICLIMAANACAGATGPLRYRTLLQVSDKSKFLDTEGASLSPLAIYIQWVNSKCGDPDKATSGKCLQLKGKLCGTRDTSEVLCQGGAKPTVSFRSSSRYTRVGYLDCSLTSLTCAVSPEISARDVKGITVDPVSIAAWQEYNSKCAGSNFNPKVTSAATCANLSGKHCSRKDVVCSKAGTDFKDLKTGKVALRGDSPSGLVYVFRP